MYDKSSLRRQDFWTALLLIAVDLLMLYKTSEIPFFQAGAAGMSSGDWYNSAALVPYCVFILILVLCIALLITAIRQGGAPRMQVFGAVWGWATSQAGARAEAAAVMMLAYIFCLVPRVDFTLSSGLVLLALIYGFHETRARATLISLIAVLVAAFYALVRHYPQSQWSAPHDDDWVTLATFVVLTVVMFVEVKITSGTLDRYLKIAPLLALIAPLLLIVAMAFGFRQNVPNRTGLVFQQIEYQYFVNLKPWLNGSKKD